MKTQKNNKQEMESLNGSSKIKPESVIIYRSTYDMIQKMGMKNRLIAYDVILNYGLNHEVPTDLPRDVSIIFTGVKPLIDANYKKRFSPKKKGSQESKKDASNNFDEEIGKHVQLPQKRNESQTECNDTDSDY